MVLTRDSEFRRDPGLFDALDDDPHTAVLVAEAGRLWAGADTPLAWYSARSAPEGRRVYVGRLTGPAGLAGLPLGPATERHLELRLVDNAAPEGGGREGADNSGVPLAQLKSLLTGLHGEIAEIVLTASALANWHHTHRYCPRCGEGLISSAAGWELRCEQCEKSHFPRLDPAVIVRVVDPNGRLLLGNNAAWEPDRFSLLAGFVEPGETLEQAIVREVAEEAGVRVINVSYLASQPWPFPASLMLGFEAIAEPDQPVVDGVELRAAAWFTRAELSDAAIRLPGVGSLSHRLISQWFGPGLPGGW